MTFTEAAVEILRLAGRPLHYKKITELAIARNLLSHVGKAPELTMSSRLATAVKAERNETSIVKVKPGIFALRDFTKEMLALADEGEDIDVSQLPESAPAAPTEAVSEGAAEAPAAPKPRLPGADVFPVEDDDDQPILAGLDAIDEAGDEDDKDDGRRGRRRRRRRGRSGAEEASVSGENEEARPEGAEPTEARPEARPEGQGERERGERDRGRGDRDRDRGRGRDRDRDRDRDRHARDGGSRDGGGRDGGGREGGGRDRDRDRDRGRPPQVDLSREPQEGDLLGRELSDAVHFVMSSGDASPQTYGAIAGELVRRGRLSGDAAALAPTVAAAIRADSRRMRSERARFRHVPGGVALTDWYLPRDAVFRERDAIRAAERQRFEVRRAFLRKIAELPPAGFAELVATWLSAEGVGSLRGVRRPTSSAQEMHFAGVLRRGHEETRIAILVLRDQTARELAKERVIEMRGSLHHYGSASITWIITLGAVPRATRDEAGVPGTTPVAIWDGQGLAEAMESRRVGLIPVELPISSIDLDLLDSLRGQAETPMREWSREGRDREPRESREPREAPPAVEGAPAPESGEAPAAAAAEGGATPSAEEGAAPAAAAAGQGAQAEGEGGRRRRRRRRRRGGAAGNEQLPLNAEGGEAEGDDETEGDEPEAAAASPVEAAPTPPPSADADADADEDVGVGVGVDVPDDDEDDALPSDDEQADEDE